MQESFKTIHPDHHEALPVPPHLHRRTPLRQSVFTLRRILLLPPHHPPPRRRPGRTAQPPEPFRSAITRRPQRDPVLHRRSPPPHSQQRDRLQTSRPPPLRPSDRQPQPAPHQRTHPRQRPSRRSSLHTQASAGTLAPRIEVAKQEERQSPLLALIRENLAQDKAEAAAEKLTKEAAAQAKKRHKQKQQKQNPDKKK